MQDQLIKERRRANYAVLVAVLLAGALLGVGLKTWSTDRVYGASASPAITTPAGKADIGSFAAGFAPVVKPALPAVVNISSSKMVKPAASAQGLFNDPMFRQFFGDQFGQQFRAVPQREHSLGSGVVVSSDGYILTNNHVIDGASDIKVQLSDKREFTAKLIGTDPRTDIGLLKIDAKDLTALSLGDSSQMQVGDFVLAIGDPFGIGETVTMGIVSATGRSNLRIEGPNSYEDFIQTDAAINHGNSGGALINARGECIGINTAILPSEGGGNQGIGFAIPINMAKSVMDQLRRNGKVVRGYLGIAIQNVTPEIAQAFGLNANTAGALVGDVTPGTPAADAGLAKGDVVVELNGQPVTSSNDLSLRVSQLAPGTTAHLKVLRNNQAREFSVKLGEYPEIAGEKSGSEEGGGTALDGVQVEALTLDMAQQLNLPPGTHGVVVTAVDQNSAAAETGLTRGDVIQEVNRKPVTSVSEYSSAIRGAGGKPVLLLVDHAGRSGYVVVTPH